MAARAIGSVTVSFGLISIPTKIYLAASPENFSFNMITRNGNRIKQKIFDTVTAEEVSRDECVKGFEVQKDQFITFTEEEIVSLVAEKTNSIDLCEFVPEDHFDPVQVEKTYWLVPDKGSDKSYQLLVKSMGNTGKMAVGTWSSKGKDNLVLIRSGNDRLVMHQIYYVNEIRSCEYVSPKIDIKPAEMELANMLIQKLSSDKFDASKYHDQYAERVRTLIQAKMNGESVVKPVEKAPTNAVVDLLELLKKSLNENGK